MDVLQEASNVTHPHPMFYNHFYSTKNAKKNYTWQFLAAVFHFHTTNQRCMFCLWKKLKQMRNYNCRLQSNIHYIRQLTNISRFSVLIWSDVCVFCFFLDCTHCSIWRLYVSAMEVEPAIFYIFFTRTPLIPPFHFAWLFGLRRAILGISFMCILCCFPACCCCYFRNFTNTNMYGHDECALAQQDSVGSFRLFIKVIKLNLIYHNIVFPHSMKYSHFILSDMSLSLMCCSVTFTGVSIWHRHTHFTCTQIHVFYMKTFGSLNCRCEF